MSIGTITAAAVALGLLASVGLLLAGMPRRSFLKAWPVASALLFTLLLGASTVMRFAGMRVG
ncbi:hypothetical protein [Quisquiliibacterium transsilvanicum]|uniref:Uncharacterized protein n=1 Tax=Quisquiliibacterium transsilvanicum TaxID=1549638 RepID=A0A7W8HJB9_9BURK|nr:hypothetical protein [Quisquiliibacterium transsilvanicum]MBB5273003.1 hypothetical protein [Quisquiliibacterium transsilvanicum]